MRYFYIALEIIWLLLGLTCIYLFFHYFVRGHTSYMFLLLGAVALGMAYFRFSSRRKREQNANNLHSRRPFKDFHQRSKQ